MSTEKIKSRKINKENKVLEDKDSKVSKKKNPKSKKKTLDDVLGKVDTSRSIALERRVISTKKSLKGKKIKSSNLYLEEKKLDKEYEKEDNLSVTMMILILVACFVIGGILGYMLYRIAMNSSNALLVIQHFLR